ncbi:response regulator transcription factor [Geodermatophilus pulveris]|uniref:response regulator transcription factor n=1 Tax=Geodermatophilus pulveris TaxID=1564159 RepID=UPI001FE427B8|nr:LuxR C-terminal-related transcriptional regulator [Geodermatophilus pulveris]
MAIVMINSGVTTGWFITWQREAWEVNDRISGYSSLDTALARRQPSKPGTAFLWSSSPGETLRAVSPPDLVIPILQERDRSIAWVLGRLKGHFSNEEVGLATLLIPGLLTRVRCVSTEAPTATRSELTARENAVLDLMAAGLTNRVIARQLGISERTVHKHVQHIYQKLGCHDRLSAVLLSTRTSVP